MFKLKLALGSAILLLFFACHPLLAQRIYGVAGGPHFGSTADKSGLRINRFKVSVDQDVIFTAFNANYIFKIDHNTRIVTPIIGSGKYGDGAAGPAAEVNISSLNGGVLELPNGDIIFSTNARIWRLEKSTGLVSLFAGSANGFSGDGGLASFAKFLGICDLAVNSLGDVFVSDCGNFRIRKIDHATGIITTVIGNGIMGSNNNGGLATAAAVNPSRIAIATNGDIYFSESSYHVVRKIAASTGLVSLVAGNYSPGSGGDGGQATSAGLYYPNQLIIDGDNLYISDGQNSKVRKVALSTGIISTYLGSGVGAYTPDGANASGAAIRTPSDLQMVNGEFWFSEVGQLRKISQGIFVTLGGIINFSGDGGPAQNASLSNPVTPVVNQAGDIIFCDKANHRVRKISKSTGIISTIAGTGVPAFSGDNGPASAAALNNPSGLAIDPLGNLYIADSQNG